MPALTSRQDALDALEVTAIVEAKILDVPTLRPQRVLIDTDEIVGAALSLELGRRYDHDGVIELLLGAEQQEWIEQPQPAKWRHTGQGTSALDFPSRVISPLQP